MELRGIDVSKHQGKIDWEKVNVDFAIIRVGYSKYAGGVVEDEYFKINATECERRGIPYGVYVYAYDKNAEAVEATVRDILLLLKGRKITYPVYYDIEETYGDNNTRTSMCNAFCKGVRQAGYIPGVYSYYSFFRVFLDMSQLEPVDKWVADYRGKRPLDIPHQMWQYTGSGTADGIKTAVDLNICYKDYTNKVEEEDSEIAKLIQEIREVVKRYEHD